MLAYGYRIYFLIQFSSRVTCTPQTAHRRHGCGRSSAGPGSDDIGLRSGHEARHGRGCGDGFWPSLLRAGRPQAGLNSHDLHYGMITACNPHEVLGHRTREPSHHGLAALGPDEPPCGQPWGRAPDSMLRAT